jgi:hypothetical protein
MIVTYNATGAITTPSTKIADQEEERILDDQDKDGTEVVEEPDPGANIIIIVSFS